MSKKTIWLIIGLMSISLLGLLSFQAYWIKQSIEQKKQELKTNVSKALAGLDDSMREEEALVFIQREGSNVFVDSLEANGKEFNYVADFRFEENEDSITKDITTTYKISSSKGFQGGVMIMDDQVGEVDVINLKDSAKSHIKLIKRFNEKKFELSEAIDKIAFEFAFKERTFADRISSLSFDSLLNSALEKEGLSELEYQYTLKDLSTDSLLIEKISEQNSTELSFSREILNTGHSAKGGLLQFRIKDSFNYLLGGIAPILSIALLLTFLLLFTFFFTLHKILQQKKLSQMKLDFINNMTHEFKTPIATISLAIDSIFHPKVLGKEEEMRRLGDIIKKENERMHQQVERLLQTAQFENGKTEFQFEKLSLHQLLKEIKEIYANSTSHDKAVSISLELDAQSDLVNADSMHLFNAVRNIVDNAIKFSKEEAQIKIKSKNRKEKIIIEIIDKGIGMNAKTIQHIFDSFYRYTEGDLHNTKGFGLGLAYVKEVCNQMDVEIEVKSQTDKGTSFKLIFELTNEKES